MKAFGTMLSLKPRKNLCACKPLHSVTAAVSIAIPPHTTMKMPSK